ncbi:unnamed protein product [Protopolystoma xenopodis]|uniref:Uncharacterized protein n=1 Tax=Protopolystoma xenopodis TaxID=117903 RepID=A0A3S5FGX1_9PLAT|nr:unnamed protein product [Protopolystoma xenopodis]
MRRSSSDIDGDTFELLEDNHLTGDVGVEADTEQDDEDNDDGLMAASASNSAAKGSFQSRFSVQESRRAIPIQPKTATLTSDSGSIVINDGSMDGTAWSDQVLKLAGVLPRANSEERFVTDETGSNADV